MCRKRATAAGFWRCCIRRSTCGSPATTRSARRAGAGDAKWTFSRYLLTLVAGGIALFIPGPWIASRIFHADFAASFLTFTALVNIHHFILDGALWKLRDSRIAAFLLNTNEKAQGAEITRARYVSIRSALADWSSHLRREAFESPRLRCFWHGRRWINCIFIGRAKRTALRHWNARQN